MKTKAKRLEVSFKMILLFFFIFLYVNAFSYPQESKQFPHLIAFFSIAMLGISLLLDFTRRDSVVKKLADAGDKELRLTDGQDGKGKKKRLYWTWGIILVATAVGFYGGFLFSTFILFVCFAIFFGQRKELLKNIVIAILVTLLTYLIFQWLMGVPLLEE